MDKLKRPLQNADELAAYITDAFCPHCGLRLVTEIFTEEDIRLRCPRNCIELNKEAYLQMRQIWDTDLDAVEACLELNCNNNEE